RDAPYRPGRSDDWLKIKCSARQEFVIGGFTDHSKEQHSIGALLIGYFENGDFVYAGRVGTGFDLDTRKELRRSLDKLAQKTPAFKSLPAATRRGAHWVEPKMVAEIAYSNWTRDGVLRHPSFQGLRMDKPASSITRDKAKPVAKAAKAAAKGNGTATKGKSGKDEVEGVTLTHADRVLYAEE